MLKKSILILFQLLFALSFGQNNKQWRGYFSYNQIKDVTESNAAIYAASENALFLKNNTTNEIKTINSIDGLKAETITAIYHSDAYNKTLIGNQNGLLLVLNSDGSILYKNGIQTEVPVSPLIKKINSFYEYEGKVYISCDYGITVFNFSTLEFGDTYYIGNNGAQDRVFQTTVIAGEIFACTELYGIKKASITNPNLVDFNQWQTIDFGYWKGLISFQGQLIAMGSNGDIYKYNGTLFQNILNLNQVGVEIRTYGDYIIATSQNHVYVLNQSLTQVAHIQSNQITDTVVTFTCATVVNTTIYIGTNENGLLTSTLANPLDFQFIKPDGPERNKIFRLKKSSTALWAIYGRYNRTYNPYNPDEQPTGLKLYPISKFQSQTGWSTIPYTDLLGAKSLSNMAINPNNESEFYISSYFSGLLKFENEAATTLYNTTNTGSNGLESLALSPPNPSYVDIRVNGPAFDKNGNLWMTNSLVVKGIKVLKSGGQWQSYDLSDAITNPIEESYGVLVIDKNNTKWIPTAHNGVLAFNENYNNKFIDIKSGTEGNLPSNDARCLAIDNKNQLWIGTDKGLRIIPSVDSFISETDIQSKNIVILENDLAQELFYQQFILDIAVDGANRKWVSTADTGVFLVSSNGQETIYHFTKENSPLPSNNVNDIEIDGVTGEVFFATDKGLVSFKGVSTKPSDDLNYVYVYPNPVRPEFTGTVKIAGLTNKATVKITDVGGSLVFETSSEGGTIEWDTTAFGKYKVASGVYMVLVSAEDGLETTVKKVMIIR